MAIIKAEGLAHKQGSKFLLRDIDWTVEKGENWIVFGANGCGKTTLLSTVIGYRGYSRGRIELFDQELTLENSEELRRRVGFVSTSYFDRLFFDESPLDIVVSARFGGLGRREQMTDAHVKRARDLLRAVGVASKGDYPYSMLSQGQRQRVLLARGLMVEPELLVLDEPLTGLDIMARDYFLNTLREIVDTTDVTVIYVTHHAEEILPFYTKALLMKDGKVYRQGDLEDVFAADVLKDYFGHPAQAAWHGDQFHITIGEELRMPRAAWA